MSAEAADRDNLRLVLSILRPTLTAVALAHRDLDGLRAWAREGFGPVGLSDESGARLTAAADAARTILDGGDALGLARLWFLGANPLLGDDSPVRAIHQGKLAEVKGAAKVFADDGWS